MPSAGSERSIICCCRSVDPRSPSSQSPSKRSWHPSPSRAGEFSTKAWQLYTCFCFLEPGESPGRKQLNSCEEPGVLACESALGKAYQE